ncbi:MAG: inorganic phosphate transporter [Pseudomarimonas sp.]
MSLLLLLVVIVLAAANGANDNIKGAATLVGSGLLDFRRGILWASAATAAGGLLSIIVASGLLAAFGGRGIVPDEVAGSLLFLTSVGLGAAITVWLATRMGLPISTTHGLLGGLLGAGLAAAPSAVDVSVALRGMLAPLLAAPVMAITLALLLLPLLRRWRRRAEKSAAVCVCAETLPAAVAARTGAEIAGTQGQSAVIAPMVASLRVGRLDDAACQAPSQALLTLSAAGTLDRVHLASALAVSFARGLNDTPKIAALMVAAGSFGAPMASGLVVVAMTVGGLFASRRVADTLAFRVTRMDPAEGLGANLITAGLVIVASRFGLPVSTTHVSTGAVFGIAATRRSGGVKVIAGILAAWLLTLPLAAALAAASYQLMRGFGT